MCSCHMAADITLVLLLCSTSLLGSRRLRSRRRRCCCVLLLLLSFYPARVPKVCWARCCAQRCRAWVITQYSCFPCCILYAAAAVCCCCCSHSILRVFLKCAGRVVVLSDALRGFLHKIHVSHAVSNMFLYTACIDRRLCTFCTGRYFSVVFACSFFMIRAHFCYCFCNKAKWRPK